MRAFRVAGKLSAQRQAQAAAPDEVFSFTDLGQALRPEVR